MSDIESALEFSAKLDQHIIHEWGQDIELDMEAVTMIEARDRAIRAETLHDAAGRLSMLYGEFSVGPSESPDARKAVVLAQQAIRAMIDEEPAHD